MLKRRPIHFSLLSLLCLLLISCQSLPEHAEGTGWADVTLHATGHGPIPTAPTGGWSPAARMEAIRQAKLSAYRELSTQMLSLKTARGMTVSEWVAAHPELSPKIAAYARGATLLHAENREDGIAMSARLYLGAHFESLLGLSQKKTAPASTHDRGHAPTFQ